MKLAVIPGDGIGPEVVAEGLKVLARASSRTSRPPTYDLGAARWHRTGELLPDSVLARAARARRDPARRGRRPDACRRGILERGLLLRLRFELDHHVNLRPGPAVPGRARPAGRRPGDRHGRACARAPRARTRQRRRCCARTPRTRSPPRSASNTDVRRRAGRPRRVRAGRRAAPRKHLTLVHKTNVLTHAGQLWSRVVEEVSHGVPGRRRRLPARRRRDDLPGHRPRPVRRGRHRQPVRRHPHRPRRRRHRRHRPGRQRQPRRLRHQPEHVRAGARLARRTSPARASPTRPPPCCRSRCCWTTSAHADAARRVEAAVAFDLATRDHQATGHTQSIGDRLAALVSRQAAPASPVTLTRLVGAGLCCAEPRSMRRCLANVELSCREATGCALPVLERCRIARSGGRGRARAWSVGGSESGYHLRPIGVDMGPVNRHAYHAVRLRERGGRLHGDSRPADGSSATRSIRSPSIADLVEPSGSQQPHHDVRLQMGVPPRLGQPGARPNRCSLLLPRRIARPSIDDVGTSRGRVRARLSRLPGCAYGCPARPRESTPAGPHASAIQLGDRRRLIWQTSAGRRCRAVQHGIDVASTDDGASRDHRAAGGPRSSSATIPSNRLHRTDRFYEMHGNVSDHARSAVIDDRASSGPDAPRRAAVTARRCAGTSSRSGEMPHSRGRHARVGRWWDVR